MGHSLLISEAMKVTLVLFASVAFVLGCPDMPCKDDEMPCWRGWDSNDCDIYMCIPMHGGPTGKDGNECPVSCPCRDDELTCDSGLDEATGCMMAPECRPMKQGMQGKDGSDRLNSCPCKGDEMPCYIGDDPNGCPLPEMCIPKHGGPVGKDGNECPLSCPCQNNQLTCDSGFDEATGCAMAPQCRQMDNSGGMYGYGKDGYECLVECPCRDDEIACPRGQDSNGCMRGDMCQPMKGGPVGKDGNAP